jgi:hypothetical protein
MLVWTSDPIAFTIASVAVDSLEGIILLWWRARQGRVSWASCELYDIGRYIPPVYVSLHHVCMAEELLVLIQ